MYLLDTRWIQMHNAMRVRGGTITITGSHPHSRWSLCAQGHSILSQYQASYPAIWDIATSLSLNKLLGAAPVRAREEESTGRRSRCRPDPYLEGRCPCVTNTRHGGVGGRLWVG